MAVVTHGHVHLRLGKHRQFPSEEVSMLELGAGIFMLGQSVVMTQPICQGYSEIADQLVNTYNETMIAEESGPEGSTIQYWGNALSGSYIVVMKKEADVGCIMEFGQRKPT